MFIGNSPVNDLISLFIISVFFDNDQRIHVLFELSKKILRFGFYLCKTSDKYA